MSRQPPVVRVAIALVRRDERWLVARRRKNAHLAGQWEFPGGKIEPGETPESTAVRELLEECAVRGAARGCLDVVRFEYPERLVEITPVMCDWIDGEAHAVGNDECCWVTDDELKALEMPAANAEVIAEALANPRAE
ncbi:MAG: (deoxy)nucleoside triphosphate pyrophosphohydrolase [Phycisphaerales bacterium]|nr:(deoxy)nucleoside triphosphate pyrophosphohydrolase [Phycisphaerales bacterium]